MLGQEHQCDGDFNISSSSSADINNSSKTDENVPLTESYEGLDEKLDDGDEDEVNDKPPVPKKNKLGVSRLIDNKRKHLQKKMPAAQRE